MSGVKVPDWSKFREKFRKIMPEVLEEAKKYGTAVQGRYAGDGVCDAKTGGAMSLTRCEWCGRRYNFRKDSSYICTPCWRARAKIRVLEKQLGREPTDEEVAELVKRPASEPTPIEEKHYPSLDRPWRLSSSGVREIPVDECPRSGGRYCCSVNKCPLDPGYKELYAVDGDPETVCKARRKTREAIAARYPGILPNGGLTDAEIASDKRKLKAKARWNALPEEEKARRLIPFKAKPIVHGSNSISNQNLL